MHVNDRGPTRRGNGFEPFAFLLVGYSKTDAEARDRQRRER
jgi:hypothetical protein